MAKNFLNLICLILIVGTGWGGTAAFAERKFSDLPDSHWAASSVYDLVKLGATSGYPDGTFRGDQKITRYETAMFISKLAEKLGGVDLTEVKEDIAELKTEIAALRRNPTGGMVFSADVKALAQAGNLFAAGGSRGPVMGYRLKTLMQRDFGDGAAVAVNLDTMDAGYGGGSQNFGTKLLDVAGKLKLNLGMDAPVEVLVTVGPGSQTHVDSTGVLRAASGEVFVRPDSGVAASTTLWGMGLSGGVWSDSIADNGYFNSAKVIAGIDYSLGSVLYLFSNFKLGVTGIYLRTAGGENADRKINLLASTNLGPKIKGGVKVGIGGSTASTMLVGANLSLEDVWNTGTLIDLSAVKIGAEHINSNFRADIVGLDVFNRAYVNSLVDIGGSIVQAINSDLAFKGVGDLRLSSDFGYGEGKTNSSLTVQGGLTCHVAPATEVDASYRIFQDPNASDPITDMAVLGLTYKF